MSIVRESLVSFVYIVLNVTKDFWSFLTHTQQNIIEVLLKCHLPPPPSSSSSSSSSVICFFFCIFALVFMFPFLSSCFFHITLFHTEPLCFTLVLISPASLPLLCRTDDICRGWNELRVERITQRTRWVRRRDICLRGKGKVRKEVVKFIYLQTWAHGNRWWKNACWIHLGIWYFYCSVLVSDWQESYVCLKTI